jgi:flagellar biogenesis protein FliO
MIGLWQWMPAALICLGLAAWAWRLRLRNPESGALRLETLGTTTLVPSQRVVAVRAAHRVYLLAVTPQGVSAVGEMDLADWQAAEDDSAPTTALAQSRGAGN